MRGVWLSPSPRKALGRREPRAALWREGGASPRALAWPCDTDLEDVRGVLPRWHPAPGGQPKGDARRLLRFAAPVALGHPAKGCHRLGTDRHADVIEPSGRGGGALRGERGAPLLADGARGAGVEARCARRQRGRRAPLGCEPRLAWEESACLAPPPLEERLTGGQGIAGGPPLGEECPPRGPPRWRHVEHPLGPGDQAMSMHHAGCGTDGGRRSARQEGGRALA